MSMLTDAVALQESGILVAGMTVTDLSSGYSAAGEPTTQHPEYLCFREEGVEDVRFRGTALSLARLEELYELVDEVLCHREAEPHWSSMNPPEPRMRFPHGVGLRRPDVVIAGQHAPIIAAFLRMMGLRARPLDMEEVWAVAAELEEAQVAVEGEPGFVEDLVAGDPEQTAKEPPAGGPQQDPPKSVGRTVSVRWLRPALAGVAVLLCLLGGTAVGWSMFGPSKPGDTGDAAAEGASETPGLTTPAPLPTITAPPAPAPSTPFAEHKRAGGPAEHSAERADVPVAVAVPGWRRIAATRGQEEFHGPDPDMRVLVAAKPTPLGTQEELDGAMHTALAGHPDVEVLTYAPVSYMERFPDSTTVWHVRLVDGHQMSIGCQYRQITPERQQQCEHVVGAARPELPGA